MNTRTGNGTGKPATARDGYRASTAIRIVTARELRENLTKKGSIITLVISLVAVVGGVLAAAYFFRDDGEQEPTTIAVVGAAPFADSLAQAPAGTVPEPIDTRTAASADEARAWLDDGDVDAVLAPAAGGEPDQWTLLGKNPPAELVAVLEAALTQQLQSQAIAAQGGDPAAVAAAAQRGSVTAESVDDMDAAAIAVTLFGVVIMIMGITLFANSVAGSVIEEKSSRVVEILLASVRPLHLLTGKLIGAGVAGLIMMAVIIGAGSITLVATGLADDVDIPWSAIATILPFFLLGYIFFAALYATAGSLVSRMEDFGGVQTPVMILLFVSIYVPSFGWMQLDSTFMRVAAWIPPASITTAPLQYASGEFSGWELLGSAAVLAVTCVLVLMLAAKIYPANVLHTGSRVTWLQAFRGK